MKLNKHGQYEKIKQWDTLFAPITITKDINI